MKLCPCLLALVATATAAAQTPRSDAARDRPDSVGALLQLARQQSGRGDTSGALESLGRARTLAPNSEDVLSAIAQVSLAAKAPVPAIVTLEALTRICPSVGQYHYLLGVALMGAGDMPAAVEALGEAEGLEPQRALTLLALGIALNNVKRYGDARTFLLRSLEQEPESVDAVAALAEAEAGVGELDAADAHAQRALAKSSGHVTANLVAGLVLMERLRYSEARDALARAVASDPASSKAHYQLSLAYARLGDDANSQKHVELYQQTLRDLERRMSELRSATGTEQSKSQSRHPKEHPKPW